MSPELTAERLEAQEHERARAAAFARHLRSVEPFHAVEAEDGVKRRLARRLLRIKRSDQRESLLCGALGYRFFGLRVESREQLARRHARSQYTRVAEFDMRGQSKNIGANVCQELLCLSIKMLRGWGEQNEGLAQTRHELTDNEQESIAFALKSQQDGNSIGRPGADLSGSGQIQIGSLALKPKGLAQRASKPRPAQCPDGQVLHGQLQISAIPALALANA